MNLDLTKQAKDRLDDLAEVVGASSQSDVVRRALRIYDYLVSEQQKGNSIVVKTEDGDQPLFLG